MLQKNKGASESNVIELIHKKEYAHRVFIREWSDLAKTQYKRARNDVTASIRESKREYFTACIDVDDT